MAVQAVLSGLYGSEALLPGIPGGRTSDSSGQSSSCCGYYYRQMSQALGVVTNIASISECFHSTVKFLICFSAAVHPKIFLEKLSVTMIQVDEFVDGVRVFDDIRKLVGLEYVTNFREERYASVLSDIAMLGSDLGAAVSLAGFLNIVDTDRIARAIGSVSVFGVKMPQIVPQIIVGTISLELQTIAFLFMGVQSAVDLSNGDTSRRNMLWLATSICEIVHKVFLLAFTIAVTTTGGIVAAGVLGMIANGLGVWAAYEDVFGPPPATQKQA